MCCSLYVSFPLIPPTSSTPFTPQGTPLSFKRSCDISKKKKVIWTPLPPTTKAKHIQSNSAQAKRKTNTKVYMYCTFSALTPASLGEVPPWQGVCNKTPPPRHTPYKNKFPKEYTRITKLHHTNTSVHPSQLWRMIFFLILSKLQKTNRTFSKNLWVGIFNALMWCSIWQNHQTILAKNDFS